MKVYLLDKNRNMVESWRKYFGNDEVEIVCRDFFTFMYSTKVECVVSPANSFGLMDGGYDLAITEFFGDALKEDVQKYIIKNFNGEQPVGTAFIIDIPNTEQKLIHTPTMRTPSSIKDPLVVYFAMRETLRIAKNNNVESIVIPAFGGLTGGLDYDVIAQMMKLAFDEYDNVPENMTWEYAYRVKQINYSDNY